MEKPDAIPGYTIKELIYTGECSAIYRATALADQAHVIIKLLSSKDISLKEISRIEREKKLSEKIAAIDHRYRDFIQEADTYILIFNDEGEETLASLIQQDITLKDFLIIAINITKMLSELHQLKIIHKDIKPKNILVNPLSKGVKIIDLGIAEELVRKSKNIEIPHLIEGSPEYMSPEQTSRMNRSVDYRTDFYSLGITLYEMLIKKVPFVLGTDNLLEIIYAHMTQVPTPPHELNPAIPSILSTIIMKLISKNVEDRYQSEYGIIFDLNHCLEQLEANQTITPFPIAQKDLPIQLQISQKLYGREADRQKLIDAFLHCCKGKTQFIFVTGYSGVGKSSLVHEIYLPITERKGYFIWGKFDQYQRDNPYSALLQAFKQMIQQRLADKAEIFLTWKNKLLTVLKSNAQIIVEVLPELELVIGKQQEVEKLDPIAAKNRFEIYFQIFFETLLDAEHPLTIFLDDLQWADVSSLKFLKNLMLKSTISHLLIIGAYRDNEVDSAHPLIQVINEMQGHGLELKNIQLHPLEQDQVIKMLCDTLFVQANKAHSLGVLCYQKTRGNPFFLNQFLKTLYQEALIFYNFTAGQWDWDIDKINQKGFTDNVIDLVTNKIKMLSPKTQHLLQFASCLGTSFDLNTLSIVYESSPQETAPIILQALQEELVLPLTPMYKYIENIDKFDVSYRFSHDRIQQAVYTTIPEDLKKNIHFKIANLLKQKISPEELEEHIFEILPHFNYALEKFLHPSEKEEVAKMNALASQKAKKVNAYAPALNYINIALQLLDEDAWKTHYAFLLSLYLEKAELLFLMGNTAKMNETIDYVFKHTQSKLDQINFVKIKCMSCNPESKFLESIDIARKFLSQLGIHLRKHPNTFTAFLDFLKIRHLCGTKNLDQYLSLPKTTDPHVIALMELLGTIISPCYSANPELLLNVIFHGLNLSIHKGISHFSPFCFMVYSLVLAGQTREFKAALNVSKLSVDLLDTFPKERFIQTRVLFSDAAFIHYWRKHIKETLPIFQKTALIGVETGDLEYASYSFWLQGSLYFLNAPLSKTYEASLLNHAALCDLKQEQMIQGHSIFLQAMQNLMSTTIEKPWLLIGSHCQRDELLVYLNKHHHNSLIAIFAVTELQLCYIFENFDAALANIALFHQTRLAICSMYQECLGLFYETLTYLAIWEKMTFKEKFKAKWTIYKNCLLFKKFVKQVPVNFMHLYYLVEAERARIKGNFLLALQNYTTSIEYAHKNKFLQEEAIAHEKKAKLLFKINLLDLGQKCLKDAYSRYSKWGAESKLKQLKQKYLKLLSEDPSQPSTSSSSLHSLTSTTTESLDLSSLIKSTQAISREMDLSRLIQTLLDVIVENAGADAGVLIIERNKSLFIEGEISTSGDPHLISSKPLEQATYLPNSLILYVYRSKIPVILNNASQDNQFINDPYFFKFHPKSIFCLPIIYKNIVMGVIYLENRKLEGAFTSHLINILEHISAQAAISLENARFYEATERFVPTQFLSQLGKRNLIEFNRGDCIQQKMSILFCDIREFTHISEQMEPQYVFKLLNDFMEHMEKSIQKNNGFIDKYIGDAIMALFNENSEDALNAAIDMLRSLHQLNLDSITPLSMGIGINTGEVLLGIMGGKTHLAGTVIGDSVNVAARLEQLTKIYKTPLLIGEMVKNNLLHPSDYSLRLIDNVLVKGKSISMEIWEVCDADEKTVRKLKMETLKIFNSARQKLHENDYFSALSLFETCVKENPADSVARFYLNHCRSHR